METQEYRRIRLVLSTNKKSDAFHVSEWPFSVGGFLYVRFFVSFFFLRQHSHNSLDSGWLFQHSSKDRQQAGQWHKISDQNM